MQKTKKHTYLIPEMIDWKTHYEKRKVREAKLIFMEKEKEARKKRLEMADKRKRAKNRKNSLNSKSKQKMEKSS